VSGFKSRTQAQTEIPCDTLLDVLKTGRRKKQRRKARLPKLRVFRLRRRPPLKPRLQWTRPRLQLKLLRRPS